MFLGREFQGDAPETETERERVTYLSHSSQREKKNCLEHRDPLKSGTGHCDVNSRKGL